MSPERNPVSPSPVAIGGSAQRLRRQVGPVTGKGQSRRTELLAAARRVFERQGFLDARVADIVAEARVAQGTFYTYFEDKDAVFEEVARAVVDEIMAALRSDTHAVDPYERLAAANRRFVDAYRPNARIVGLMEQVGAFTPKMKALRLDLRQDFIQRSARGIRRLQDEGVADPDIDAYLVAEVLGTMVEYTCYVWMTLGREYDEDALVATLTEVWAKAVGIPRPTVRP